MTRRKQKRRYLLEQKTRTLQTLADPTRTRQVRTQARLRLSRLAKVMRELPPIPVMKRGLEIDKVPRRYRRV